MIVSDSTTLIILFDLKRLELLENLFDEVYISPIILEEISIKIPIILPSFMSVKKLEDKRLFDTLKLLLDLGESEAIALAKEQNLSLIIDEKKGRRIAKDMELKVIGLLGVVYLNVKKKYLTIDEAESFLTEAINHGYRISKKLLKDTLSSLR